jgi:heme/copper-type cytochrome/quinol oxidase subunit 2
MQPDVIDYASERTRRRRIGWLRLAPFFAVVCSAFAWLKSAQYHGQGQFRDEQMTTLLFMILSLPCLAVTFARFRRYRADGRAKLVGMIILSVIVLAVDVLAVWNLSTATVGAKDRLF